MPPLNLRSLAIALVCVLPSAVFAAEGRPGLPTSQLGALVSAGELLVCPSFEYSVTEASSSSRATSASFRTAS